MCIVQFKAKFMICRVLDSQDKYTYYTLHTNTHTHTHTHRHMHFTALWTLSGITWVSWYQKGKINLDFTEVKSIWILLKQEAVSGSGISWVICISASHPRQIATQAPHHSLNRWGGKLNHLLMAYSLSNICRKNCWNRTTTVKIVAGGWVVYFFGTQCISMPHKQSNAKFHYG